jgi:hypothetical protein
MIILLTASSLMMAAAQESIAAPTEAFRGCLRESAAKANSEKVAADAIDAYLKNACSAPMGSLKSAVIAFRMKNGMGRKAAADDAEMTVDDYVATPADKYRLMVSQRAPAAVPPAPAPATAQAATLQPAAQPQNPKK